MNDSPAISNPNLVGNPNLKTQWEGFEIPVLSELYGQTVAVISDYDSALAGRSFPCADGSDYQLTRHEKQQLANNLSPEDFTPSFSLKSPLNFLAACEPTGNFIKLPAFQLEKGDYQALSTLFKKAGGKYQANRNQFHFSTNAAELYDFLLENEISNLQKEFQFFETPAYYAEEAVKLAEIEPDSTILEPSAGQGAILKALAKYHPAHQVDGFELMPQNREILAGCKNFNLLGEDFLTCQQTYDRIIANPPFRKNQDITHIRKMYELLNPGGVLVSFAAPSFLTSSKKTEAEFRDWLNDLKIENVKIIRVPANAFKASGTNIPTVILKIVKK